MISIGFHDFHFQMVFSLSIGYELESFKDLTVLF